MTTPVLIVSWTTPENVSSSGILNSRCQLEGRDVDVLTTANDVEGIGSLFVTGGTDVFASIADVGKVEVCRNNTDTHIN